MRTEPVTINEFAEAVRQDLQERLSGMYPQLQVNIQHVEKLQGESYLGVRIDRGDGLASPVIDLEGAFHEMKVVRPYEKVLADLTDTARSILNTMPEISAENLRHYDQAKNSLIMQAIPIRGNEERLADMPHREMEDMAVVYRVMVSSDGRGEMSYLVTNPLLEEYGITPEQLYADAVQSMREQNSYSITPLFNVLAEIDPVLAGEPMMEPDNSLLVATNEQKIYGAGVIAMPEFMEEAAEKLHGDYFILPSSIHEVLLLKDDGNTDYRGLELMVREINATQVAPNERLSDNVYHYDAGERVFETAKHFAERQMEKEQGGRGSVLKGLAENRQKSKEQQPRQRSAPERGGAVL